MTLRAWLAGQFGRWLSVQHRPLSDRVHELQKTQQALEGCSPAMLALLAREQELRYRHVARAQWFAFVLALLGLVALFTRGPVEARLSNDHEPPRRELPAYVCPIAQP